MSAIDRTIKASLYSWVYHDHPYEGAPPKDPFVCPTDDNSGYHVLEEELRTFEDPFETLTPGKLKEEDFVEGILNRLRESRCGCASKPKSSILSQTKLRFWLELTCDNPSDTHWLTHGYDTHLPRARSSKPMTIKDLLKRQIEEDDNGPWNYQCGEKNCTAYISVVSINGEVLKDFDDTTDSESNDEDSKSIPDTEDSADERADNRALIHLPSVASEGELSDPEELVIRMEDVKLNDTPHKRQSKSSSSKSRGDKPTPGSSRQRHKHREKTSSGASRSRKEGNDSQRKAGRRHSTAAPSHQHSAPREHTGDNAHAGPPRRHASRPIPSWDHQPSFEHMRHDSDHWEYYQPHGPGAESVPSGFHPTDPGGHAHWHASARSYAYGQNTHSMADSDFPRSRPPGFVDSYGGFRPPSLPHAQTFPRSDMRGVPRAPAPPHAGPPFSPSPSRGPVSPMSPMSSMAPQPGVGMPYVSHGSIHSPPPMPPGPQFGYSPYPAPPGPFY